VCCVFLRLALYAILKEKDGEGVNIFAPVCSTWVFMSSGTTYRSYLTPHGVPIQCNEDGDLMVSRLGGKITCPRYICTYICCVPFASACCETYLSHCRTSLRMVLLLQIVIAKANTWLVEQPGSSVLIRHCRMEWFVNKVCFAWALF
jgi:hypothetical protein